MKVSRGFIEEWVYEKDFQNGQDIETCDTPYPLHMDWSVLNETLPADQCAVFQGNGYGQGKAYRIRRGVPPTQPRTMTVNTCLDKRPESGWVVTARASMHVCSITWTGEWSNTQTRGFMETWVYDKDIAVNQDLLSCDDPARTLPNWILEGITYRAGTGYNIRKVR